MNRTGRDVEIVPALAEHVARRMFELGIDGLSALAQETDLTVQGLQPLLRGERRKYQARLTNPVCRVFGWSQDSIGRIMDGGEPMVTGRPANHRNGDDRNERTLRLLEDLHQRFDSLELRLGFLERRVERLADPRAD
jgi:hypothetical protein